MIKNEKLANLPEGTHKIILTDISGTTWSEEIKIVR